MCVCVTVIYSDSLQSTERKWPCMNWSPLVCACTHTSATTHTWLPAQFRGIVNKEKVIFVNEEWQCYWTRSLCNCVVLPFFSVLDVCVFHDLVFNWQAAWHIVGNCTIFPSGLMFFYPKPLIFKRIFIQAFNVSQQNHSGIHCHWLKYITYGCFSLLRRRNPCIKSFDDL